MCKDDNHRYCNTSTFTEREKRPDAGGSATKLTLIEKFEEDFLLLDGILWEVTKNFVQLKSLPFKGLVGWDDQEKHDGDQSQEADEESRHFQPTRETSNVISSSLRNVSTTQSAPAPAPPLPPPRQLTDLESGGGGW
mgnify:FL=1